MATIGAIALYTILAGASPSVLRAAVMAGVALLSREMGRPGTAARALAWAIVLLVVATPATVTDAGFQLSAAATAGLLAWGTTVEAGLRSRLPRLPGFVVEGLAVSLAAQAATLPIVLLTFGRLAPLSPLLNLVVVPLVPAAMATGTLALLGGLLAGAGAPAFVAMLLGLPGALVIGLLAGIVQAAADLPFAGLTLPPRDRGGARRDCRGPAPHRRSAQAHRPPGVPAYAPVAGTGRQGREAGHRCSRAPLRAPAPRRLAGRLTRMVIVCAPIGSCAPLPSSSRSRWTGRPWPRRHARTVAST